MQKKGQAAMEFLMTYGWAILAAIVVIAVLAIYFRPSALVTSTSIVSAPFFANAQAVSTSGISLEIKNQGGDNLNITSFNVTVKSPTTASCTQNTSSETISAGETKIISLGCSGITTGDTLSGDITIKYLKSGSSIELVSTGSIASKAA